MERKHDTSRDRLTDQKVRSLVKTRPAQGKQHVTYHDGGGLFLRIGASGSASWFLRYMLNGRARDLGLGPARDVGLAKARQKARDARERIKGDGIDPLAEREAQEAATRLAEARSKTFRQCAEDYIAAHAAGWRNPKHRAQWPATLGTYAHPTIGDLAVSAVDTGLVLKVLQPIWTAKPETAGRLRGRMESVLDWAKVCGHRDGENPARWRGHLDKLLPNKTKVHRVQHHAALPFAELPAFMVELRAQKGIAVRALELTILTATRTGEMIGAEWPELDLAEKLWTVPASRMKSGREHRVPLSERAVEILQGMRASEAAFVFAGAKAGKPLSNMAMLQLLKRMGRGDLTVHGFRSTFRDWAAERTEHPNHVVEMALAHAVGNSVEAAYRRGDLFAKRHSLMETWAKACSSGQ